MAELIAMPFGMWLVLREAQTPLQEKEHFDSDFSIPRLACSRYSQPYSQGGDKSSDAFSG